VVVWLEARAFCTSDCGKKLLTVTCRIFGSSASHVLVATENS
jgi:hypothetical protein